MNDFSLGDSRASNDRAVNRLRKQLRGPLATPPHPSTVRLDGPPPLRERLERLAGRIGRTAPEGSDKPQ